MRKPTVLMVLSLSLTAACMSEASWSHRDRSGMPLSTWEVHAQEQQRVCRELRHAALVAYDSLSERQLTHLVGCGDRVGMLHFRADPFVTASMPEAPVSTGRPPQAPVPSVPNADTLR